MYNVLDYLQAAGSLSLTLTLSFQNLTLMWTMTNASITCLVIMIMNKQANKRWATSHRYQFLYCWLTYSLTYHFFLFWLTTHQSPLSLSKLPHCFTPGLKLACFSSPSLRSFTSALQTAFADYYPHRLFWATRFLFLKCLSLFFRFWCCVIN